MGCVCHSLSQNIIPPSKGMKPRDDIQKIKQKEGVPIKVSRTRSMKFLQKFPTLGLQSELLLQYI